jgi:hypothetical protein
VYDQSIFDPATTPNGALARWTTIFILRGYVSKICLVEQSSRFIT